ncbi:myb-like protein X [Antennarius striatus]|uniref:myb-like protein X n=1 Tax=Antennarius striatus TaxID=241820 RepID=UPI0035AEC362
MCCSSVQTSRQESVNGRQKFGKMEASMMRPEAKKRQRPPKPPPKPPEMKRNDPEKPSPLVPSRSDKPAPLVPSRQQKPTALMPSRSEKPAALVPSRQEKPTPLMPSRSEKPTPLVPSRPSDAELSHTQYRIKNTAATNKEEPKAPTRSSQHRSAPAENTQSSREEADLKQNSQTFFTGLFQRSKKENSPSFTSYVMDDGDEEGKSDALNKQAPGSKLAKGELGPDPSTEKPSTEKEPSTEENKQEKYAEPKQDIGDLIAGIFRRTPKEKPGKASSDPEEAEEAEEKSSEKSHEARGLYSSKSKHSHKSTDEAKENLTINTELSASNDSLSENSSKEKGGIFGGMFRKSPKPAEAAQSDKSARENLSGSNDNLSENSKEKGGFFGGIMRKSPKIQKEEESDKLLQTDPPDGAEPPENAPSKEKGGIFSGMFKKSPKLSEAPRLEEGAASLQKELSASTDSLTENKEKGSLFGGLLRKTPKAPGEENPSALKDPSDSNENLSKASNTKEKPGTELSGSTEALDTKEKGGIFSGLFKKTPKLEEPSGSEEEESPDDGLSRSNENISENKEEKGGGFFSGLLKKTPKASGEKTEIQDNEAQKELASSADDLSENNTTKEKNIFSNMFKKPQKPAESAAADKEQLMPSENLSRSCENLSNAPLKEKKGGGLGGIFKRSASIENMFEEQKGGLFSGLKKKTKTSDPEADDKDDWKELTGSVDSLPESTKEKKGGLTGIFKKSPKPAPRSVATTDPLQDTMELSSSWDSLVEPGQGGVGELSASNENLSEGAANTKEKKGGFGLFRRTPKSTDQQESKDTEGSEGGGLKRKRTIKKKTRVVSFRVKKTPTPKFDVTLGSDKMPAIEEEAVEMRDLNKSQESSEELLVQPVEMAAYPTEHDPAEPEETDELMEWWNTVKGWAEWNETSNFHEDEEEMAMEQAADRVYMAARLFVRLFNQRGASLQHRILELLALADASDQFHKKTVSAAVGGGVASVAGSLATITGLILAPFTFGASIIVTAVGIGVATAGSITSATANITDTVHSNMDRKKLEKMIQGYQDEIKVIRECMEFVQAGMDTLEEWDFEKYSQSATKKALNHNLKHVMKEGGRAGKALMINTDKLISTVQILGAAGGAAKAAQAISVTTGVMSALFLALDVFFLAKDSHELRKGAKTKFATKIRDVCKELQDGLLELNKVKTQLQKTMDGIEVEEYEEIEEVEVEVDHDFESDPEKLAELEQELDLMEEKLDKKVEEEQKKNKEETEKQNLKNKEENEGKSLEETKEPKDKKNEEKKGDDKKSEKKGEGKSKHDSKLEKDKEQKDNPIKAAKEEDLKEQSDKNRKKEKESENRATAGKEENQSKKDIPKESGAKTKTDEKEREWNKSGKEPEEIKTRSSKSKLEEWRGNLHSEKTEKESRREGEGVTNKEEKVGSGPIWRHSSSSSDKEKPPRSERESKHGSRGVDEERESHRHRTASWRRTEEGGDERRESTRKTSREDHGRQTTGMERHEASWVRERSERETGGRTDESERKRSHHGRGAAPQDDPTQMRDERGGPRRESTRSPPEERGKSDRDVRANDGDLDYHHHHHHHHSRGSRRQSRKLLEEGLNI